MRSSGRIPKQIPIVLIGSDLGGRVFSEHTTTVLLNLHGAGILSRHKLSPEQELVLRWPEKNREVEIRVVGHLGEQSGQHTYGVAFFDSNLNFWEINFPPISSIERDLGLISIVCSSCNTLEKIDDTTMEADVCATNESVVRFCKRCSTTTLWKLASSVTSRQAAPIETPQLSLFSPSVTPSAPVPILPADSVPVPALPPPSPPAPPAAPASFYAQSYSPSQSSAPSSSAAYATDAHPRSEPRAVTLTPSPPAAEKPAAPRANRRKHPRVKVNYAACIRHPERGEAIVQCEDMSKGGLRFKSRTHYYAQTLIEVAVPYEKGQPAIFVPAQIVFVEELPEQRLFRYGVQYLKATKSRDYY